jgi:hypothetical protein
MTHFVAEGSVYSLIAALLKHVLCSLNPDLKIYSLTMIDSSRSFLEGEELLAEMHRHGS